MYLDHFGLREAPFRITPHTEFFFAGANRGATLEALIYAVTHDEGIVKVSGEVGSGKTMLCRMLLERLPDNVETVYLANPSLSRDEMLHAIADELQTPLPEGRGHFLLRALQERLLEIYATGRQVVVMIDEAHAMPPETLEEIRLLSNLESNRHKLLHIVLFGQPELDTHLGQSSMRQLKERITHNFALEPLHRDDIGSYLMFRIRAAGYKGPDLFTPRAVQLISKASEGLTRRVNILADKALLSAFAENAHLIDHRQAKAAIRDAQFKPMRDGNARPLSWIAGALALGAVATIAYLAGSQKAPAESPPGQAIASPATEAKSTAPAQPALAAATVEQQPRQPALDSAPAATRPTTLAEHVAATRAWLATVPDSHYVIQLLSTDGNSERDVMSFLDSSSTLLDRQQLRAYRSNLSGRDRLGVIYGDFPTLETANTELAKMLRINPASKPYVRSVSKLR